MFTKANETCKKVEVFTSRFLNKRTQIINVAFSEGLHINNTIQNASEYVLKTQNISDFIELEAIEAKKRLSDANHTLAEVNQLLVNASRLLQNTSLTGRLVFLDF